MRSLVLVDFFIWRPLFFDIDKLSMLQTYNNKNEEFNQMLEGSKKCLKVGTNTKLKNIVKSFHGKFTN